VRTLDCTQCVDSVDYPNGQKWRRVIATNARRRFDNEDDAGPINRFGDNECESGVCCSRADRAITAAGKACADDSMPVESSGKSALIQGNAFRGARRKPLRGGWSQIVCEIIDVVTEGSGLLAERWAG
jgi:hypothetical protein